MDASPFADDAAAYDAWYRTPPGSLVLESELRAIRSLTPEGVGLEVGVGTGVFSTSLGVSLGIDPSLAMLMRAKDKGVDTIRGVGEYLPLRRSTFDFVLFATTICFLDRCGQSFSEARRVLKKGGCAIVGFIARDSEWGRLYQQKKEEGHRYYKYASFYSIDEVNSMLRVAGFTIIRYASCLVQNPEGVRLVEDPSDHPEKCGFICIKAVKS
jgi:ubiquinone/menaquinone biosynthesis C-methylase UbiE